MNEVSARRVAPVLVLVVASGMLFGVKSAKACVTGHLRVGLDGFTVEAGPQSFYAAPESAGSVAFRVTNFGDDCVGELVSVAFGTSDVTATASEDYTPKSGRTPPLNDLSHPEDNPSAPTSHQDSVGIVNDSTAEAPVEAAQLALSDPQGGVLGDPSVAPIYIVDDEAPADRVGFASYPYAQSETFAQVAIPVFRGGPVSGSPTVSYTVGPGGPNPATPVEDFAAETGQVTFGAGSRWEMISITIANDAVSEAPETLQVSVTGANVVGGTSAVIVTILDNEENQPPNSRLHHPRHKWRYKKSDYRIREVHIFTNDNLGGSGVVGAHFALRRNMKNGDCFWLTKGGWQKKDCSSREWLGTVYDSVGELWRIRLKQLKSSVGTRIKNYTAFSRAVDGAGNVEKDFAQKRNDNTFEVKRSKGRR
jgi:hypothetical protein